MTETYLSSLNAGLHRAMQSDPRVHFLGEDILDPYGGAFKVAKGLSTAFPDRVWPTPISEAAITGVAVGLAMRGMRPVAEMMFGDFLTLAADQLINHAAKFPWMFNGGVTMPLVVRAPMGARRGYGATHSQSLEKHFLGVPGLWVVAPSVAGDPGALIEQSIGLDEPVLFIESKTCYARSLVSCPDGMTREAFATSEAPFETVRFRWKVAEPDGVMCCYGGMTPVALDAIRVLAASEGLRLDLVVFAQLSPTPVSHLQWMLASAPGVCAIVEESSVMAGWSSEWIAAITLSEAPPLGAPRRFVRVGSRHEPIGSGKQIEHRTLPQVEDLVAAVVSEF